MVEDDVGRHYRHKSAIDNGDFHDADNISVKRSMGDDEGKSWYEKVGNGEDVGYE